MKKNEDEKKQLFIERSYNLDFYVIRKMNLCWSQKFIGLKKNYVYCLCCYTKHEGDCHILVKTRLSFPEKKSKKDCFCKRHELNFMTIHSDHKEIDKKIVLCLCFSLPRLYGKFDGKKIQCPSHLVIIPQNIGIIFVWTYIFLRSAKIQLFNDDIKNKKQCTLFWIRI